MQKKLLLSRTGFEKPESRVEAIMQNILGASNVLEPAESNIEEILQAILYNTPYTKEAEFEIEKILLAIKNNGTYDGEGESRDMKILIAILNDLDYTEEAESRIEELFIEWLHQRSSIKALEGIPPLTFTSLGFPLINYLIEGNTVQDGTPTPNNPVDVNGVGNKTANLWKVSGATSGYLTDGGAITPSDYYYTTDYIVVKADTNYRYSLSSNFGGNRLFRVSYYDTSKTFINNSTSSAFGDGDWSVVWATPANAKYIRIAYINPADTTKSDTYKMMSEGSTAQSYEPYGYKIPISSASTTTPVNLGSVASTRQIKKWVFDGTENWANAVASDIFGVANLFGNSPFIPQITALCTEYTYNSRQGGYASGLTSGEFALQKYTSGGNDSYTPYFRNNSYTTVDQWKAYLQQQYANGTPVTVWYVLATAETATVNEPLMKIGNYADTLSKEQAGVEIPTASGSNTLDVDTTVKPSNIYIEYK